VGSAAGHPSAPRVFGGVVRCDRDRAGSIRAATTPWYSGGGQTCADLASGHVRTAHAAAAAWPRTRMCPSRRP